MEKLSYTIPQLVQATGIGRTKIFAEIKNRRLRSVKCGSRTLITVADAKAWLERLAVETPQPMA